MATEIDIDATMILNVLAGAPRGEYVAARVLAEQTGLAPDRVNDAVSLLVEAGYVEWNQLMGTAPFDFSGAIITVRGRRERQRLDSSSPPAMTPGERLQGGQPTAACGL